MIQLILAIVIAFFIIRFILKVVVVLRGVQQKNYEDWMVRGLRNQQEGKPWEAKR